MMLMKARTYVPTRKV